MSQPIFVVGYPSFFGGADTELWHTVRLWRRAGYEVSLIPTWSACPTQRERLKGIGARTALASGAAALKEIPGLPGSTVVSFCNGEFLKIAGQLRELECRLVWANCMTWAFPAELAHYEKYGPFDGYLFQSEFQRSLLSPIYARYGATDEQFHLIRGAFDADEFPFAPRPHSPGDVYVMGRIARDDLDKWSSNLWPIYSAVRYARKRARVMAWSERLTKKCGAPPSWAEPLSARAETAQQFLGSLHCLFPINGGARENWPRAGLEAMAAGVPIVAQNEWGWKEMILHGETGFLGSCDEELAHWTAVMAYDERVRLRIAQAARDRLVSELANPERIWSGWQRLFECLARAARAA